MWSSYPQVGALWVDGGEHTVETRVHDAAMTTVDWGECGAACIHPLRTVVDRVAQHDSAADETEDEEETTSRLATAGHAVERVAPAAAA